MSLRAITWNVQWATPRSPRTPEILRRIDRHAPELVCLTETHVGLPPMLPQGGHTIASQPDYGYTIKDVRRKVVLWSRKPWKQVESVGIDSMPPGRFVSGVTETSLGAVTVIGICSPWFGSRTEASRKSERKMRWEDHEQYLAGLTQVLRGGSANRTIVMGDFNQIVGKGSRAPHKLQLALQRAFSPRMTIDTEGLSFRGRGSIDHIASSKDLSAESVDVICNIHNERKLSDHFGVVARFGWCGVGLDGLASKTDLRYACREIPLNLSYTSPFLRSLFLP